MSLEFLLNIYEQNNVNECLNDLHILLDFEGIERPTSKSPTVVWTACTTWWWAMIQAPAPNNGNHMLVCNAAAFLCPAIRRMVEGR